MTVNDYKNTIEDIMRDANHNLSAEKFKDLAELVVVMGNSYLTAINIVKDMKSTQLGHVAEHPTTGIQSM